MIKIATHDSATGEKIYPFGYITYLFAKTQTKTIEELWLAGCRLFDLRAKKFRGEYHPAHGSLYINKRTTEDILALLDSYGERVYIILTYEGRLKTLKARQEFLLWVQKMKDKYLNLYIGPVYSKYGDFGITVDMVKLIPWPSDFPKIRYEYIGLNGKNWQSLLPIPWLWKKKAQFSEEYFTLVDFL